MIYLLIILVSGFAGWKLREKMAIIRLSNYLKAEIIKEEEDSTKVDMIIEKTGDMFYLYNKETDMFLAQGRSLDEIKLILEIRFPNVTFNATVSNIEEVDFK